MKRLFKLRYRCGCDGKPFIFLPISKSISLFSVLSPLAQELYTYRESVSAKNNFTEYDVMEDIRNYRKNK
jgi:hypothetical protein